MSKISTMNPDEFEKILIEHAKKYGDDPSSIEARKRFKLAYSYYKSESICPCCGLKEWDYNFESIRILGSERQGACWFECDSCGRYSPLASTWEEAFSMWKTQN